MILDFVTEFMSDDFGILGVGYRGNGSVHYEICW